jgi:transcriptional regulator with XRE-family HTH domain
MVSSQRENLQKGWCVVQKKGMNLLPEQIRAARALLDWSRPDLAKASGVAAATISDYERGKTAAMLSTSMGKIERAFEMHGVVFFRDGDFDGVKLRRKGDAQ